MIGSRLLKAQIFQLIQRSAGCGEVPGGEVGYRIKAFRRTGFETSQSMIQRIQLYSSGSYILKGNVALERGCVGNTSVK